MVQDLEEDGNEEEFVDGQEVEQEISQEEEDAVTVDNDSSDGAVLVNGNEAEEEEWGTNNAGKPSA